MGREESHSAVKTILHITTRGEWEQASRRGAYEAPSLASEGFIHCSTPRQTAATANRFFRGASDLVLLVIDASATTSAVRYEPPASPGHDDAHERFPHLYGPLNLEAVVDVVPFPARADGSFVLPDGIASRAR